MIKLLFSILVLISELSAALLTVLRLFSGFWRLPLVIGFYELIRKFWRTKPTPTTSTPEKR